MFDTLNLWLNFDEMGAVKTSNLYKVLSNPTEHQNNEFCSLTGNLKNLKIGIYDTGISIKGSIAKYYMNDNLQTLTRSGTELAIKKLSDELYLPIEKAKVNRLDIATHFMMKHRANEYFSLLGDKPYFQRVQATGNTLYYNTKLKKLVFYDKIKEAKNFEIPSIYKNENLLRYELRHTGRLTKHFNMYEVKALNLYEETFYINLIDKWVKEYFAIKKNRKLTIKNMDKIRTVKDAENIIFGIMLNKHGLSNINEIIKDMKLSKVYPDPKYYSRLKGKLEKLAKLPEITEKSELINELDKHVNSITQYYR